MKRKLMATARATTLPTTIAVSAESAKIGGATIPACKLTMDRAYAGTDATSAGRRKMTVFMVQPPLRGLPPASALDH